MDTWTDEKLKDYMPEYFVIVTNATVKGAKVLAREQCTERGKCAVIQRNGGPANRLGLDAGVLIWFS